MVTCNIDSVKKMERPKRGSGSGSTSSGFRLLDDHCDTVSSISRNSIYKIKIDSMFDDTRSIASQRLDERSSIRNRRLLPSSASIQSSIRDSRKYIGISSRGSISSMRSSTRLYQPGKPMSMTSKTTTTSAANIIEYGVECVSNKVQEQIEQMFTDVADESTCSFPVRCLGSLPLASKVTSLLELQEPLRKLYLSANGHKDQCNGDLDICASGLRVRVSGRDSHMTPFHHIAVWSAVKFIISSNEGGAAFLPLITDPENIDKSSLFQPLTTAERRRLSSGLHAPIFTVVMRSMTHYQQTKQLECHAFVCQSPENAIVIAATLYQCLLAHMGNSQNQRPRKPRNQNGVSCISLASGSMANRRYGNKLPLNYRPTDVPPPPPRPARMNMKRTATSSLSGDSDNIIKETTFHTSSDQRKKKSHKNKRAPPVPNVASVEPSDLYNMSTSYRVHQRKANRTTSNSYTGTDPVGGDILTRVAIPRSGSFLNTSGLTRYKSRATRRAVGKIGGGGGSPLGFSELFNEFRLQENLHSLDDILNAIIDSEGMSFNDLKPIYKEFLLKLAVTLTKDELYQRSKSIMRRQKKRQLRRKKSSAGGYSYSRKNALIASIGLKRVFRISKYFLPHKPKPNSLDALAKKSIKQSKNKMATSGSDLSETHNELTLNGQNRNSSSGYVSCSECSYNSDACTCTSAERCYCSLGHDHDDVANRIKKTTLNARDSLLSCQTEDKCYCSMGDSSTTWCDTDSCISTTKCYCKNKGLNRSSERVGRACITDSLALDYELFTVGNNGKPVRQHEAISVKKSVEMAAVFTNVKLSTTTDITNMVVPTSSEEESNSRNSAKTQPMGKRIDDSRRNSGNSMRSKSDTNPNAIEPADMHPLFRQNTKKMNDLYQTVTSKTMNGSLEDSLGYLP